MLIYKELGDEQSAADALKARDSTSGDIYMDILLYQISVRCPMNFRMHFGMNLVRVQQLPDVGLHLLDSPNDSKRLESLFWMYSDVGAFIHCCHWPGNFLNFFRCWWFGFMMFHLESWRTGRKLRPLKRHVLVCSQSFLRIPRQSLLQCLSKRARIEDLGCLEQRKVTKSPIDPYIWIHRGTPSVKIGSDQRSKESVKWLMYVNIGWQYQWSNIFSHARPCVRRTEYVPSPLKSQILASLLRPDAE